MYLMRMLRTLLYTGPGWLCMASCQYGAISNAVTDEADTFNFPLRQYAASQIQTYFGTPYSLFRISHIEGRTDTTIMNYLTMDWSPIFQTFLAADISSKKFAGQYTWSVEDEPMTGNRGYTFTAKNPALYTRLLHVNTDPFYHRITSIYIETHKHDFWGAKSGKLLYIPAKLIQIQERRTGRFEKARSLRVEYKALSDDEDEAATL